MWKDFIKGNAPGTEVGEKPGKAGKFMRSLFESDAQVKVTGKGSWVEAPSADVKSQEGSEILS